MLGHGDGERSGSSSDASRSSTRPARAAAAIFELAPRVRPRLDERPQRDS
jgi:hypothetical protein